MIDWLRIFEQYGVEHVIGPAPNVRHGRIGIACPLCDRDDKTHFSVEEETGRVIGCWRDRTHWMSPTALLARVTGMTYAKAKAIAKDGGSLPTGDTPGALLAALERQEEPKVVQAVQWAPTLRRFNGKPAERRFLAYLTKRGFDALPTARQFGLRYAISGRWASRIAVPIWRFEGKPALCGWSARAIADSKARYIAEPAGDAMQRLLWESWEASKGDTLVVVEGPFDALKLAAANVKRTTVVALLTNAAGRAKIARLLELGHIARQTYIVLDRGAERQALDLQASLAPIRPRFIHVPEGYKDPGELPLKVARRLLKRMTDE